MRTAKWKGKIPCEDLLKKLGRARNILALLAVNAGHVCSKLSWVLQTRHSHQYDNSPFSECIEFVPKWSRFKYDQDCLQTRQWWVNSQVDLSTCNSDERDDKQSLEKKRENLAFGRYFCSTINLVIFLSHVIYTSNQAMLDNHYVKWLTLQVICVQTERHVSTLLPFKFWFVSLFMEDIRRFSNQIAALFADSTRTEFMTNTFQFLSLCYSALHCSPVSVDTFNAFCE